MNTTRTFGVEIEVGNKNISTMANILRGAGFNVYNQDDDSLNIGPDTIRSYRNGVHVSEFPEFKLAWRVIADGSVSDGCEVVSPILSGREGLTAVKGVVKAMNKFGTKATNECGLHVHVGVNDLTALEFQNIARRYEAFESVIDTFVSPRRRADKGKWCLPMNHVVNRIDNMIFLTHENVARHGCGRYRKLNLCAYIKHGTVEFRQLEGTTSWTKIVNWIEFCVSFVEASRLDETEVTAYNAALDRVWNGYPEAIRSLSGRPYVNASILGRLWNLEKRNHILNQIKAINAAYPGAFEERWDYWNVNISFPTAKAPAVTGAWSKGIPTHVVSHLLNIAKKHNETAVSV